MPAQPGYELLRLDAAGEVLRRPIIAWMVTPSNYGVGAMVAPLALGVEQAIAFADEGYAIRMPGGRVCKPGTDVPRFYESIEAWAKACNKELAAAAWDQACEPVVGGKQ